ncbi:CPBP family intramembrane glutamic endopeptidase [Natribaculum luteum]|uniref:CPBP family intramembrane glutamic endopeptidase n=1 Tax=Natribaculum luteum TaxID=1586232 RepID=A0ABD5NXD6_9EURY|nr:type II CAAX endopeptidase family protein [Natribaculum luteum]
MPDWATFAGLTGVVLVLLLALSHLTSTAFTDSDDADTRTPSDESPTPTRESTAESTASDPDALADGFADGSADGESLRESRRVPEDDHGHGHGHDHDEHSSPGSLSTGELLANVAFSQGLFATILLAAAVYTEIPPADLGIAFTRAYLTTGVVVGTALGVGLYIANELGAASAKRLGIDHSEQLRELLAPDSPGGWAALLGVALPTVAIFEEFLFRAALIGALSAGFDVSPWLLAIVSSVAFALGHGMQGPAGIAVTGLLGFVLAIAFVVTGSVLVVIVAHYLVNALEFVVHEGLGLEWTETTGS